MKLIDVKIPADKNALVPESEKLSKYKDLEIKVEKLWHMKTVTIPAVIGALGMIKKGTEKHLEKIPWSPNLAEMEKIALTGTAHILRKTLSMLKKIPNNTKKATAEAMLNIYVLNKHRLITHHIYIYTISTINFYLTRCYLQFLLFKFSTLFINIYFFLFFTYFIFIFLWRTVFHTQCVSVFVIYV